MSDKEFLDEYILDANDQLSALNESMLLLEKNPHDTEAINRIFRAAHTLKGNSATMGFIEISSLAHTMENVLDGVRGGKVEVHDEVIDRLFESLDTLQVMIEGVSKNAPPVDCSRVRIRLEELLKYDKKIDEVTQSKKNTPSVKNPSSRVFKLRVSVSKEAQLKSVRAFMVVKNVQSIGEVVASEPDLASIEDGKFTREFTLTVKTEASKEELESLVKKVGDVEGVDVREETDIKKPKPASPGSQELKSIRVSADRLDELVNLVGELVISKSRLSQIARELEEEGLIDAVNILERLSRELQDTSLSLRMVKVAHIFDKFPRMVRDLAKKEGKEVDFQIEGKEIELDRTVLDTLGDPLVHLLRNCIDHGIEPPEERESRGKAKKGTIKLKALRVKDHVEIIIEDDGKGVDIEAVREAAVKKGIMSEEDVNALKENEVMDLIFMPGFSVAKKVSEVSGRGVGMDVVKTVITRLGGSVYIKSQKDNGTKFTLKLPLSLAIIKALLVKSNDNVYAIPTKDIVEVLQLADYNIKTVKGNETIIHRNSPLPILRLERLLNTSNGTNMKKPECIVVEKTDRNFGIAVEKIIRQEEVVVKPLGDGFVDVKGFSGATILGNGRVALILDVYTLL